MERFKQAIPRDTTAHPVNFPAVRDINNVQAMMLFNIGEAKMTVAGTIVGVMNLAGLTAPFWGHLADRRRLHRQVLLAGMLLVLAPLLLMPAVLGLPLKAGCGSGA